MAEPINLTNRQDPPTVEDAELLKRMRQKRNILLSRCDWTHTTDAVVPDQAAWATYRQALRDAPASWRPGPSWTPPDPPA